MINQITMKSEIVLFTLILISSFSYSQQRCNCERALEQLINKTESAYPGFEDKTIDSLRYLSFKEMMTLKAKSISETECRNVLREYLGYFNDRHIYIRESGQLPIDEEQDKYYYKTDITLEAFNKHIKNSNDKLEGIWKASAYKVGIIKMENEYQGFIIDADTTYWKPLEVKFKLFMDGRANYYLRDHTLFKDDYKLYDSCILYFNKLQTPFLKEQPKPIISQKNIVSKVNEIEGFYFKRLSDETALLKISSFMYNSVERIENLIEQNIDLLENSKNLIIDVRNNGGGTDDAYQKLLPYVCTGPLRMIGAEFLATQSLIDGLKNWMQKLPDEEKFEQDKKRIKRNIEMYQKHLGSFVGTDSKSVYVDTINQANHSPSQIVILANKGTGSAAENFVYKAKQSKKVKIMGTPTGGVLDYGSARKFNFGCDNYTLFLPTFRSLRLPEYPIDNIGIQPDVYLDKYVEDWIKFALDYLEN